MDFKMKNDDLNEYELPESCFIKTTDEHHGMTVNELIKQIHTKVNTNTWDIPVYVNGKHIKSLELSYSSEWDDDVHVDITTEE